MERERERESDRQRQRQRQREIGRERERERALHSCTLKEKGNEREIKREKQIFLLSFLFPLNLFSSGTMSAKPDNYIDGK